MILNYFLTLAGFILATIFTVGKAKDLKQMALTQSQLVAALQKATNRPVPPNIKLLKTKPVFLGQSRSETILISGFFVTGVLAVINALGPLFSSLSEKS